MKPNKITKMILSRSIGDLAAVAMQENPKLAISCGEDGLVLRNFCAATGWDVGRVTCAYAVLLRMNALEKLGG
jgi:hypothetical protein